MSHRTQDHHLVTLRVNWRGQQRQQGPGKKLRACSNQAGACEVTTDPSQLPLKIYDSAPSTSTWGDKVKANVPPPVEITEEMAKRSHMLNGIWNPAQAKQLIHT
ncbi:unnamed protein product [Phytophthora fragariaefolia]|uniref:Unnamed protein product n=1 Tax=Phytophthora fragariaefolia TaxID=1490495 RepID=A0A9W6YGU5_9STRA|nr:unnamed protein product [Phytophthora fragariaefolia]